MVRQCKICGTKTAWYRQYCLNCRKSYKKIDYGVVAVFALFLIIFFSIIAIWGIYSHNSQPEQQNSSQDTINLSNSSQEIASQKQTLINFCITEFSGGGIFNLSKIDYLENFSSASYWIIKNYENSSITQQQKEQNIEYMINNQLPKEGYPIIMAYGSKKEGEITTHRFYYCKED